jgi:hypothetical protein
MGIQATKPFLDLHAELRDHVEHFPVVAHELSDLSVDERIDVIERVVVFLSEMLLPHAVEEARLLYPRAALLLSKPDDSSVVAFDESAVRTRIRELAEVDPRDVGRVQELLYALYALLCSHFWREEQLYLELLASDREAAALDLIAQLA